LSEISNCYLIWEGIEEIDQGHFIESSVDEAKSNQGLLVIEVSPSEKYCCYFSCQIIFFWILL